MSSRTTGSDRTPLPRIRRVRTPTVLQMEAVECGAAALAIILAHHGRYVPLEELRLACGVSRDGSKASNVLKAARRYGLEASGYKSESEGLDAFEAPMILFWNFNHFLVLEGIRKNRVFLNDPAQGPIVVTEKEFDDSFTGVVLTFEPGDAFRKGGSPAALLPLIRKKLRTSKLATGYVFLAGLFLVVPGLVVPTFTRIFVDFFLIQAMHDWLGPLLIAMTMTAGIRAVLTWLQQTFLLRLETKLALVGASQFLWHVLRLPTAFFTQRYSGDIASRVAINDRVARLLSGDLAVTAIDCVTICAYAALMLHYDVQLTIIGVFTTALNLLALKLVSRWRVDANQRFAKLGGKLHGVSIAGLSSIESLKASGRESDFFTKWSGYAASHATASQHLAVLTEALQTVPALLSHVTTTAVLVSGGLRIMDGDLSLGHLVAFQYLMASFLAPVHRLLSLGAELQSLRADLKRLDDVLEYQRDPDLGTVEDVAGSKPSAVQLEGEIELRNVSFGYSPMEPALISHLDLRVPPGGRIALVGASGSGKSTVTRLVTGLYRPWDGEILLDGEPRRSYPASVLKSSITSVDQQIFLFEGTIAENLTLWDDTLDEESILGAARDACIHEDIASRAGGYQSLVTEGGANFSGGQRQRLEIARALVGNPRILVLDEATSALDAETERRIDRNLRRRGCTCLIVAHRLSTIRDADEIIVLDRGRVVERGTHQDLLDLDGSYARLVRS